MFLKGDSMPKIIENVRERAIAEAREVLTRDGYAAMTVRRVAKDLDIAPATLYNYFPSKEHLAACVMLEDWRELTRVIEERSSGLSAEDTVRALFDTVRRFTEKYALSWSQYGTEASATPMRKRYHSVLVEQLAGYIRAAMTPEESGSGPWRPLFLAELVLRFGSDGVSVYEDLEPAVKKILD